MIVKSVAMQAYQNALKAQQGLQKNMGSFKPEGAPTQSFTSTLENSLQKVDDLQNQRASMVESFATGKDTNVHELMITLQKAGLTMSMTSAVRSKILAGYQELTKMQF
ncbi:MAG: flagellar hook-basal body complex protein FliE [Humidesulfovibrio sp.]|nr:flagellar hook-basal body complex protein FliE [Humidesulfovibrio sp.]